MALQLEGPYKPIDSSINSFNCTHIYNVHVPVSPCLTLSSFSSYFLRYNVLFRVLLGIRRAQMALQHTWYLQMNKRQRASGLLWQLRVHMSFLIDNLQYYVQVVVSLPLSPSLSVSVYLFLSFSLSLLFSRLMSLMLSSVSWLVRSTQLMILNQSSMLMKFILTLS